MTARQRSITYTSRYPPLYFNLKGPIKDITSNRQTLRDDTVTDTYIHVWHFDTQGQIFLLENKYHCSYNPDTSFDYQYSTYKNGRPSTGTMTWEDGAVQGRWNYIWLSKNQYVVVTDTIIPVDTDKIDHLPVLQFDTVFLDKQNRIISSKNYSPAWDVTIFDTFNYDKNKVTISNSINTELNLVRFYSFDQFDKYKNPQRMIQKVIYTADTSGWVDRNPDTTNFRYTYHK